VTTKFRTFRSTEGQKNSRKRTRKRDRVTKLRNFGVLEQTSSLFGNVFSRKLSLKSPNIQPSSMGAYTLSFGMSGMTGGSLEDSSSLSSRYLRIFLMILTSAMKEIIFISLKHSGQIKG